MTSPSLLKAVPASPTSNNGAYVREDARVPENTVRRAPCPGAFVLLSVNQCCGSYIDNETHYSHSYMSKVTRYF